MERQRYCIYNQNSECFLSLGTFLAADALGYLEQMFRRRRPSAADEGQWVIDPKPIHTLRLLSAHDLVLLDQEHRVLEAFESWPKLRVLRLPDNAVSMLILPIHTIYSSQTQAGNQLLICVPEEMQVKLRRIGSEEPADSQDLTSEVVASADLRPVRSVHESSINGGSAEPPKFLAYNPKDPELRMYGVREISHTGVLFTTEVRWPVGSQVVVTFQRMDGASDSLQLPVTVEIVVAQWLEDGMAATFVRPGALDSLIGEAIGR